jgi:pyrroline-5-carboxylate reductase
MDKKIGFVGCGNMGQAMLKGMINSKLFKAENLIASTTPRSYEKLKEKFNIKVVTNNLEVADFADIIILSIKPDKFETVINEIKSHIKKATVIVSVAGGIKVKQIENMFGVATKIVRVMPNTSALVGESMSVLCQNELVSEEELKTVLSIFGSFGKTELIEENLIDAVASVTGSSPAMVYMLIEAMGDAAVIRGIPRTKAYILASQAVLGAAKMVLETGEHPGILKDNVCSPGGTTIEAVFSLEKNNFRGTIIEAMEKCTEKTIKLAKGEY